MECSTELKNIHQALLKAQIKMDASIKSVSNAFFKSKYADFTAVLDDLLKL